MKPERWNSRRAALYGLFFGLAYAAFKKFPEIGDDTIVISLFVGSMLGGAIGGAILFAAVSGIRNLFIK